MAWFKSNQMMRGTCPNCRFALFMPDPLTITQLEQAGTGTSNALMLNNIARLMVRRAREVLEVFLMAQEEMLDSLEVVDGWDASADTRDILHTDMTWFRTPSNYQELEEEVRQSYLQTAQQIDDALVHTQKNYERAIVDYAHSQIRSARERLDSVRVYLDESAPSHLRELQSDLDAMSGRATEAITQTLIGLLSDVRALSTRIAVNSQKLPSEVTKTKRENELDLDEDAMIILNEAEQFLKRVVGD